MSPESCSKVSSIAGKPCHMPLLLRGGRGTTKQGAITQAGDAREHDRWGGPETGWATEELA